MAKGKKTQIAAFEEKWSVRFCTDHTAKMEGMLSLSTSSLENEFCRKRAENKFSICHECFAMRQAQRFGQSFRDKYAENTRVLTSVVIPVEEWPILNCLVFRFEAFGDLNNATQVINYFNLCKRNPKVHFALWTKNPGFIAQAIKAGHKKPSNLIIVYSSCYLNRVSESVFKVFSFIDKVFTVFDKEYVQKHNIDINCGGRCCLTCQRCYSKRTGSEIREQLK